MNKKEAKECNNYQITTTDALKEYVKPNIIFNSKRNQAKKVTSEINNPSNKEILNIRNLERTINSE